MPTVRTGLAAGPTYTGTVNAPDLPQSGGITFGVNVPKTNQTNVILLYVTCRYVPSTGSTPSLSAYMYPSNYATLTYLTVAASAHFVSYGGLYSKAVLFYAASDSIKGYPGSNVILGGSYTTNGGSYSYATCAAVSLSTDNLATDKWQFTSGSGGSNPTVISGNTSSDTYINGWLAYRDMWSGEAATGNPGTRIFRGQAYLGASSITSSDAVWEASGSQLSVPNATGGFVGVAIPPKASSGFFSMF